MPASLRPGGRWGQEESCCPPVPHHLCLQIYFWEAERRNLTERVKTLFLAESGVKLKNLTGYTTYMVSVAAFNAAGEGPRSTPTRGQTQQAGGGEWLEGGEPAWGVEAGPPGPGLWALVGSGGSGLTPPAEHLGCPMGCPPACESTAPNGAQT